MACASRALPMAPRCERPSTSVLRDDRSQPGGFAHGPDEKYGRAGRLKGRSTNTTLLAESTRRVGTAWPNAGSKRDCGARKAARKIRSKSEITREFRRKSLRDAGESFRSPCGVDDSSRPAASAVEFVNHPKAVFVGPVRGGAIRAAAGLGSSFEIGHSALRHFAHADLWSGNG